MTRLTNGLPENLEKVATFIGRTKGKTHDAQEDYAQVARIKALEMLGKGYRPAYIMRAMLNAVLDVARKDSSWEFRRTVLHDDRHPTDSGISRLDDAITGDILLSMLPRESRGVLRDHFEGESLPDIATRTGVPLVTLKGRCYRGLKSARQLVGGTA